MTGLGNKDRSFWKKLEDWEVIMLIETWTKGKGWKKVLKYSKWIRLENASGKEKE